MPLLTQCSQCWGSTLDRNTSRSELHALVIPLTLFSTNRPRGKHLLWSHSATVLKDILENLPRHWYVSCPRFVVVVVIIIDSNSALFEFRHSRMNEFRDSHSITDDHCMNATIGNTIPREHFQVSESAARPAIP